MLEGRNREIKNYILEFQIPSPQYWKRIAKKKIINQTEYLNNIINIYDLTEKKHISSNSNRLPILFKHLWEFNKVSLIINKLQQFKKKVKPHTHTHSFQQLFHSSNGHSGYCWARLKLRVRTYIQVSHWMQSPKCLVCPPLFSQGHSQETRSAVQQQ